MIKRILCFNIIIIFLCLQIYGKTNDIRLIETIKIKYVGIINKPIRTLVITKNKSYKENIHEKIFYCSKEIFFELIEYIKPLLNNNNSKDNIFNIILVNSKENITGLNKSQSKYFFNKLINFFKEKENNKELINYLEDYINFLNL